MHYVLVAIALVILVGVFSCSGSRGSGLGCVGRQAVAMCYYSSAAPTVSTFVCPTCGERTLYPLAGDAKERGPAWTVNTLDRWRRALAALKDQVPGLALEETEFCRKCHPEATVPQLRLLVPQPEGTPPRTVALSTDDLELLERYAAGSLPAAPDRRPRLRELLGVTMEKQDDKR